MKIMNRSRLTLLALLIALPALALLADGHEAPVLERLRAAGDFADIGDEAERSAALWDLVLGVAKGASSDGDVRPRLSEGAGQRVARYDIDGVPLYLLATEGRVVLSPSERAIAAAAGLSRSGARTVRSDPAFAGMTPECPCHTLSFPRRRESMLV